MEKNFLNFFWFSVSRIVPTNVKGGIWEFLNIHSLEKQEKNKGGDPLETFEKFAKKSLTKPKTTIGSIRKKFF